MKSLLRDGRWLGLLILVAAVLEALAYWPGIMTWDAIRQYGQAIDGDFDDWHPPAMEWLWRQFAYHLQAGPAPMLVLQLTLYWAGFALLGGAMLRRGRRGLAWALVLCGLMPIGFALMGSVLKDCLMEGALLSVAGLLAWNVQERRWWRMMLGLLLLLAAAVLRFNAFLAALPLVIALLPKNFHRTPLRLGATALVSTAVLMAAMPIANRLVQAEPSGVELSLVIFDLAGITEHSGVDAFPPLGVADPVAVNHRCYTPFKWDSYSWWVDPLCPIDFDKVKAALAARHEHPYPVLARAILAHPFAYAAHRLTHFSVNTRFLVHDNADRPAPVESIPNDWGYVVTPSPLLHAIDRVSMASARTPLGWPICWIALAFGVVLIGQRLPSRDLILPIGLSALLYGMGYLVFSVATETRYHLWTMTGTLIATVIAIADIRAGAPVPRRHLAWASLPLAIVTALAIGWRVF